MKGNSKGVAGIFIPVLTVLIVAIGLYAMVFGSRRHSKLTAKESKYVKIVKDMENDAEHDRIAAIMYGSDMRVAARVQ